MSHVACLVKLINVSRAWWECVQDLVGMCSGLGGNVFRACLECVQGMVGMWSGLGGDVFRAWWECVQSLVGMCSELGSLVGIAGENRLLQSLTSMAG
jgi:hypothetical protein